MSKGRPSAICQACAGGTASVPPPGVMSACQLVPPVRIAALTNGVITTPAGTRDHARAAARLLHRISATAAISTAAPIRAGTALTMTARLIAAIPHAPPARTWRSTVATPSALGTTSVGFARLISRIQPHAARGRKTWTRAALRRPWSNASSNVGGQAHTMHMTTRRRTEVVTAHERAHIVRHDAGMAAASKRAVAYVGDTPTAHNGAMSTVRRTRNGSGTAAIPLPDGNHHVSAACAVCFHVDGNASQAPPRRVDRCECQRTILSATVITVITVNVTALVMR